MNRPLPPAGFLLLSETLLLCVCYLLPHYYRLLDVDLSFYLVYEDGWFQILCPTLAVQAVLYIRLLYHTPVVNSRFRLLQQLSQALGLAFLTQALVSYLDPALVLPRSSMLYGSLLVLVVLPAWRLGLASIRSEAHRSVLLLGDVGILEQIGEAASLENAPVSIAGYLAPSGEPRADFPVPCLGSFEDLFDVIERYRPTGIIVSAPLMRKKIARRKLPPQTALALQWSGLQVEEASAFYESLFQRVPAASLRRSSLLFAAEPGDWLLILLSPLLGVAALLLAVPVLLLTAGVLALYRTSPVPVAETRLGWRQKAFSLYRFRVPPQAPWLTRWRLHRLPEFWNAARGDLALIGPRPERPAFAAELLRLIPSYGHRFTVKPGILGWAQLNLANRPQGRYPDTLVALEYDLYYIHRRTIAMDAYILLHSILR